VTETFEVGQKVQYGGEDVTVTYGPYTSPLGFTRYIVRLEDGSETNVRDVQLDAIPETPKFSIGDVVSLATRVGTKATVEYGPFDDREVYVVKLVDESTDPDENRTFTAMAHVMTKVDEPIKVGDRVRVLKDDPDSKPGVFNGRTGTLTRTNEGGDLPYQVRLDDPSGLPSWTAGLWWVTNVERVEDENTHTHDGVMYDLTTRYRDTDGDWWTFKRIDGIVRGYCDEQDRDMSEHVSASSFTLEHVVRMYGPLTRI
jgi:hypothetical protein